MEHGVAVLEAEDAPGLASARTRQSAIESLLREVSGGPVRVELKGPESDEQSAPPDAVVQAEALKNPLVRRAMELFEARLIAAGPDDEAKSDKQ